MILRSIASGSSGNCIYVGSDATHLLVDAGISGKRIEAGVDMLDMSMSDIDAILITHEHSDHIAGLGVLSRRYNIPIYTTKGTMNAIMRTGNLGNIDPSLFNIVKRDEKFTIKDISVNPMRISHDAAEPVAYRFYHGKKKAAIVTDLGTYDDYTVQCLKGMDALFIEANHDVNMLQVGPYPYQLKQRILGDRGHLSNERAGHLLCDVIHEALQAVMLGHLSRENNMPELAYESVRVEVTMNEAKNKDKGDISFSDIPLYVAKRDEVSRIINIA